MKRSSASSEDRSAFIGKKIADEIRETVGESNEEIAQRFETLKAELLTMADESEHLEVRRRLSEALISIYSTTPDSQIHFDQAWDEIELLGYSDLERKATMCFYRANYLVKFGSNETTAKIALTNLEQMAQEVMENGNRSHAEQIQKAVNRLRAELKSSG